MKRTALTACLALTLTQGCLEFTYTETFDGDPAGPTQSALPASMDFSVTHRTHPRDHNPTFEQYPADHGSDCAGPPNQHLVQTSHLSNGTNPDESFFVCKNHMMSSMGDVEGYSVTAFWPRREFDFSGAGVLSFDVNINDRHPRVWWEVLITPRAQMKVGAAQEWLPIDETYPEDRIVLTFHQNSRRSIQIGTGAVAPDGWIIDETDWREWRYIEPTDPALSDRRIRRRHTIVFTDNRVSWLIEKPDGTYDRYDVDVPMGLPFSRGLVLVKTHAYTPEKDGNFDKTTFHWDNIRFTGPEVGVYDAFETNELVYLQANGSRAIGETETASITIPRTGPNPVVFGQIHGALNGQVLLRINGGTQRTIHPLHYSDDGCSTSGWASFRLEVAPSELVVGANTFEWEIGPRPACVPDWMWDGFSIKGLEIQLDTE